MSADAVEPPSPPPEPIAVLAEACTNFVAKAVGTELDFRQDTLPVVDHYLTLVPDDPSAALMQLIAPATGAYFGEVVRRDLGDGRWICPGTDYAQWRVEFSRCFLHFNPIAVALEAIVGDEVEGFPAHFRVLDAERSAVISAVESLGDVSEEDYYRLSVRFEVVQQVYLTLMANQKGSAPTHFGSDVYAAALAKHQTGTSVS